MLAPHKTTLAFTIPLTLACNVEQAIQELIDEHGVTWEHAPDSVDVMIVDEAHRIRKKSVPKVVAARRPKISQIEELVRAAKVTVLFMDPNQIIEPDERGDPEQVAALASRLGIRLMRHRLRAQFRCDGSDEYLNWADALFELTAPSERRPLRVPTTFDFGVMDSPHDVLAWVRARTSRSPILPG